MSFFSLAALIWVSRLMGFYLVVTGFCWRYFRLWIAPGVVLLIFSILFTIQHWPFASYLRMGGIACLAVGYAFSLTKKPAFNRLDYAKVVWAVLALAQFTVESFHWRFGFQLDLALVLGTTALTFIYMITPVKQYKPVKPGRPGDVLDWDEMEQKPSDKS